MNNNLSINLFGPARVTAGPEDRPVKLGRSALALLVFLCLQGGRPIQREVVGAELWPDCGPDRMRSRLSTAIWRLRGALGDEVLHTDGGTMALPAELLERVDLLRFERAGRTYLEDPTAMDCPCDPVEAASEPLSGWYDVWALSARVRLQDLRESCLSALLEHQVSTGMDTAAVETAEALLLSDPLREDIYRVLMQVAARQGRPGLAARHFERCCSVLADELGIEASDETRALMRDLSACGRRADIPNKPAGSDRAAFSDLRRVLQETQVRLAKVSDQLETLLDR